MSSVANVTPKMSPKYLLRSPVSIRNAIQFISTPLSLRATISKRCVKQCMDQRTRRTQLDFVRDQMTRTYESTQEFKRLWEGGSDSSEVTTGGHEPKGGHDRRPALFLPMP